MSNKKSPINFTSREYNSIRAELIKHAKRYYPDTFKDFSEASFGALMLDSVAYIGDQLSFYLDYQTNESFLDTATEYDNVVKLARQMGYKFQGRSTSTGEATFYILVPANDVGLGPKSEYLPVLKKGSQFGGSNGSPFLLSEDVRFDSSTNEVVAGRVDSTTGIPTYYAVRSTGKVISGALTQENFTIGTAEKFKKIKLSSPNCSEVLKVYDSNGHEYYEVEYLSQNVIYKEVANFNQDKDLVASILRPHVVPRRFVVEHHRNRSFIQFGYGSESELDSPTLAEPSDVVLSMHGKDYTSAATFDPSKLISSDKFGIAPAATTITVEYRVSNSKNVNVATGALTKVKKASMSFADPTSLATSTMNDVVNSLEVENSAPILGDISIPSSVELKRRVLDSFAMQDRAVTTQDFEGSVYAMPPKFGSIKRCRIVRDPDSFKRNLNLYVLSEDVNGFLATPTQTLKENLKLWLGKKKMIHDTIDILNGKVVNIGIEFSIVTDPEKNNYDVLQQAVDTLVAKYKNPLYIGEPFYITDIYNTLNKLTGVVDVKTVKIVNKSGGAHSNTGFNIEINKSADGRHITVPKNVALEIKYPKLDIKGSVV
tara:strand:+ start:1809 stop:3602 length:1794 start_codon:yes stop_codon:yes gene_type:complete